MLDGRGVSGMAIRCNMCLISYWFKQTIKTSSKLFKKEWKPLLGKQEGYKKAYMI